MLCAKPRLRTQKISREEKGRDTKKEKILGVMVGSG